MTQTEGFVVKDHDPYADCPHSPYTDGLGQTTPQVHCSPGQTPEEVQELLDAPKKRAEAESQRLKQEAEARLDKDAPGWRENKTQIELDQFLMDTVKLIKDEERQKQQARLQAIANEWCVRFPWDRARKEEIEEIKDDIEFSEKWKMGKTTEHEEIKKNLRWWENAPVLTSVSRCW